MATKKTNTKVAPKTAEKKTTQTAENAAPATRPENPTSKYKVPFISAKIDRLVDYEGSKVKAIASAVIGNHFAVHGFKVIENNDGELAVLNPATKGSDGKYYEDFHSISKEGREAINGYILDAYEQKLAEEQGEDQNAEQGESAEEDQTVGPSM